MSIRYLRPRCHNVGDKGTFCIRFQLWPLDRKVRVVHQAKDYLKRHASEKEQQLAHDRTFKGRLKKAKLQVIKWVRPRRPPEFHSE